MTPADDSRPFDDAVADLDRVALVLGRERQGLSPRWDSSATGLDSLNVTAATAVACYALRRR
jgi:tRNA G18 (ribose-2'-O)-methylase SpoU